MAATRLLSNKQHEQPSVLIVGAGVVGRATGVGLARWGFDVTFFDIDATALAKAAVTGCKTTGVPIAAGLYIFCVPSRDLRLDEIRNAALSVGPVLRRGDVCILRSTVPPGTTRRCFVSALEKSSDLKAGPDFKVIYQPEYLRNADGRNALDDFLAPRALIFGEAIAGDAADLAAIFSRHTGSPAILTSYETAELAKLLHNAFNAAKISFFNEAWQFANTLGIDSKRTNELVAMTAEACWNPTYGIIGGKPYAGDCLPKDLAILIEHAKQHACETTLLEAVRAVNRSLGGG